MCAPTTARSLLLISIALVSLGGCSDGTDPEPILTASAVATSNGQAALVGTALPLPLRVDVASDGTPKAGVTVTWQTSAGSVAPTASITDATGLAATTWTLGTHPGGMTTAATVAGAQGSPVTFRATALAPATAAAVAASDGQTGVAGTALSLPLRVEVRAGAVPMAGIPVSWQTSAGSIAPASSVTDRTGIGKAVWTLGAIAGAQTAYATIAGAKGSPVRFSATAVPAAVVTIDKVSGDGQTAPANRPAFSPIVVVVRDQDGNGVEGKAVTWTVESGPVRILSTDATTNSDGRSAASLAPSGTEGSAVVRASVSGGASSVTFALSIGPPGFIVRLTGSFVSTQNGTRNPAVDTIPAGETMEWVQTPFDYDLHRVVSVGDPSFQDSGDFPYANPSIVSVTFNVPGTYHYADFYYPSATGIIVVR